MEQKNVLFESDREMAWGLGGVMFAEVEIHEAVMCRLGT